MKKHFFILSLAAATSVLTACNEQYETTNLVQQEAATFVDNYRAPAFAEPDGSKPLTSFKAAENLKMLFNSTGPKIITSMGRGMVITDAQYQEIAEFTTNLVNGKLSQTTKYRTIFDWVVKNLTYNNSNVNYSNDPYEVFKNKKCVCQGYANLLVVMCYSQSIPAVVVNGLINGMGHAWAYV